MPQHESWIKWNHRSNSKEITRGGGSMVINSVLYCTFSVIPWIFLFVIIGTEDLFIFIERFGNGFDVIPVTIIRVA